VVNPFFALSAPARQVGGRRNGSRRSLFGDHAYADDVLTLPELLYRRPPSESWCRAEYCSAWGVDHPEAESMKRIRGTLFLFGLCSANVGAQTSTDWSFHLSGFQTELRQGGFGSVGRGGEVQIRRTLGQFSVAVGAQATQHQDANLQIGGVLFEPRYVLDLGAERMFPYLLARGAALTVLDAAPGERLTGIDLGAGGGVLIVLTRRLNLDIGAAITTTRWNFSLGGVTIVEQVQNYALKAGLSFGLGT
jgi:hypothetical protein